MGEFEGCGRVAQVQLRLVAHTLRVRSRLKGRDIVQRFLVFTCSEYKVDKHSRIFTFAQVYSGHSRWIACNERRVSFNLGIPPVYGYICSSSGTLLTSVSTLAASAKKRAFLRILEPSHVCRATRTYDEHPQGCACWWCYSHPTTLFLDSSHSCGAAVCSLKSVHGTTYKFNRLCWNRETNSNTQSLARASRPHISTAICYHCKVESKSWVTTRAIRVETAAVPILEMTIVSSLPSIKLIVVSMVVSD